MNPKLIIIILILLTSITTVMATDYELTVQYNLSELPKMNSFQINFSLAPNETIYFTEVSNDPKTILNYPTQINLNENTTIAQWIVNYTIPFFSDFSDNYTIIEDIIGVTNSINDNLLLVKLNYEIFHPPLWNITEPEEPYLLLTDGGKNVEIYTFSAIDFNESHAIKVKAPNGATINVECGQFLSCPENVTVTENDEVSIIANIFIPKGQIGGNYTSFATVSVGNNTGTINFSITVRMDDIANLILYDIWDESCYDSPENLAECYKIQARYNSEIANALLQRIQSGNYSCQDISTINETVKYVEVGNIDPELLKDNRDVRERYNTLSQDYSQLSTEYTSCMNEKTDLQGKVQSETEELSNEFILKRSSLERETLEQQEEMRQELKNKLNWIIAILFFFFLTIYVGGIYLESQWVLHNFPKKIVGVITLSILIGWIIFRIFL